MHYNMSGWTPGEHVAASWIKIFKFQKWQFLRGIRPISNYQTDLVFALEKMQKPFISIQIFAIS